MEIRFIQPFSFERNKLGYPNIGGEYNRCISELPDDCYVVLRDQDTLPLSSDFGEHVKAIIEANPKFNLIGCVTNRISVKDQLEEEMFDNDSITDHINNAKWLKENRTLIVKPTNLIAGLCMIFHKSAWEKVGGFPEFDITFDRVFCDKIIKQGGKIGIAKNLYLLHLYRWNEINPQSSIKHLRRKKVNG